MTFHDDQRGQHGPDEKSEEGARVRIAPTPGPWKTLPPLKPRRGVDDDDTRWIVVAAGADRDYLIATIENGQPGDSLETEAATARLLAAAPELLAALKGLLSVLPENWGDAVHEGVIAPLHLLADDVNDALAAIARAEGRS